jgi:ABC-type nitrate/sulfonate/bicarbonate transport system ATPase subunit/ABC-type nitrate/sulfonate/bicarbonate transport system permease component
MKKILLYVSGVLLVLFAWIVLSFVYTEEIVPMPHRVFAGLGKLVIDEAVWYDLSLTVVRTLAGCFLSFVVGTLIGVVSGYYASLRRSFFIPVSLLQGAPPLLWVIPVVLMLGTGGIAPFAVVFMVTLPLVLLNIQEGMRSIRPSQWEMFRVYAPSKKLKFLELVVPSLRPSLKSSLVLTVILGLKSSVLGEWFASQNGIGRRINELYYSFDMVSFYSYALLFLFVVVFFAFVSEKVGEKLFAFRKISKSGVNSAAKKYFSVHTAGSRLVVDHVSFSYGSSCVLADVSVSVTSGETVILTGASGAGKTTLAKISAGILKPSGGKVLVPENTGFLFQDDALLHHRDCLGNVLLPMRYHGNIDVPFAEDCLKICGLDEHKHLFPEELSGGMRKRLAFARALTHNPGFMILDEPFNNLDRPARENLWNLYFEIFSARGIPALIITHYPEEISSHNCPVYVLDSGKINPA